jgi:hypothetical protein
MPDLVEQYGADRKIQILVTGNADKFDEGKPHTKFDLNDDRTDRNRTSRFSITKAGMSKL